MGIAVWGGEGQKLVGQCPDRWPGPEIFKQGLLLNIYRYLRAGFEQKYWNGRKLFFFQSPISEQYIISNSQTECLNHFVEKFCSLKVVKFLEAVDSSSFLFPEKTNHSISSDAYFIHHHFPLLLHISSSFSYSGAYFIINLIGLGITFLTLHQTIWSNMILNVALSKLKYLVEGCTQRFGKVH